MQAILYHSLVGTPTTGDSMYMYDMGRSMVTGFGKVDVTYIRSEMCYRPDTSSL